MRGSGDLPPAAEGCECHFHHTITMTYSTSLYSRNISLGSLSLLSLACGFAQETAQKTEDQLPQTKELKEVVVTSDLWQSLLSDIPASVSVFDAETLKNQIFVTSRI